MGILTHRRRPSYLSCSPCHPELFQIIHKNDRLRKGRRSFYLLALCRIKYIQHQKSTDIAFAVRIINVFPVSINRRNYRIPFGCLPVVGIAVVPFAKNVNFGYPQTSQKPSALSSIWSYDTMFIVQRFQVQVTDCQCWDSLNFH